MLESGLAARPRDFFHPCLVKNMTCANRGASGEVQEGDLLGGLVKPFRGQMGCGTFFAELVRNVSPFFSEETPSWARRRV